MSGRKSTEVAGVLQQAEAIQNEIFNFYGNKIESQLSGSNKLKQEIDILKIRIGESNIPQPKLAKQEFSQELDKITKSIKEIVSEQIPDFDADLTSLKMRESEIKKIIKDSRNQSVQLRNRIRSNPHYCNTEYNEALNVRKNLNYARGKYNDLLTDSNNVRTKISKNRNRFLNNIEKIERLNQVAIELELKAKKIIKIRNEANQIKVQIQSEFDSIDIKNARKFSNKNYQALKNRTNKFMKMNDEKIILRYTTLSSDIFNLSEDITQKYQDWLSKKQFTESYLKEVEQNFKVKDFQTFKDEIYKKDTKIHLFEFLRIYSDSEEYKEINNLISKAKEKISKEYFDEANDIIKKSEIIWNKLIEIALQIREKTMTAIQLTLKMRDIMQEVGFNTDLQIINNSYIDGFSLKCTNGDTINFEKIIIEKDGETTIELDHQEGITGTCSVRWKTLQQKFQDNGIPVTDVKKNNRSVIYKDHRKKKENQENKRSVK